MPKTQEQKLMELEQKVKLLEKQKAFLEKQVWASDITYLGSRGSHQYLALVTDTYSKKILGYDVSSSLSAEGAARALKMGLRQRTDKGKELIHHSDRGYQYCCDGYQAILRKDE